MHQQNFLIIQHPTSGIARTGLGEFPVTSLGETELFELSHFGELNVTYLIKLCPH
jgi:hypothetical protein